MDSHRLQRIGNLLRNEISSMITKQEIKDPRVTSLVTITHVTVSKDLAYAKVYISSVEGPERLSSAVEGLNHAAGFIQGTIGKRIKLRVTPKLTFIEDHSIDDGFKVLKKIKESLS
ncbi:MAG: 30S ribosome-binding factor RbfA [Spirochaetales bacterium]